MGSRDYWQTCFTRALPTLLSVSPFRNDPESQKSHLDRFTLVLYYNPIATEHKINQA
jgi:hypothetical protein